MCVHLQNRRRFESTLEKTQTIKSGAYLHDAIAAQLEGAEIVHSIFCWEISSFLK
jgi:hypothetical protein